MVYHFISDISDFGPHVVGIECGGRRQGGREGKGEKRKKEKKNWRGIRDENNIFYYFINNNNLKYNF